MSEQLPRNWGIKTPERLLRSLRVAENGGDVNECADALEWMLRSGRLIDRGDINWEAAYGVAVPDIGPTVHGIAGEDWIDHIQAVVNAAFGIGETDD